MFMRLLKDDKPIQLFKSDKYSYDVSDGFINIYKTKGDAVCHAGYAAHPIFLYKSYSLLSYNLYVMDGSKIIAKAK